MRVGIRIRFIVALAIVGHLLAGGAVHAADYVVKIGADTQSGRGVSSLICWFDHTCHGELKELGLQVDIDLRRAMSRIARLRLHGSNFGCCYFEYGRDQTAIDLRAALHQEPIFKDAKARGGMIVNERVGSLYLKFRLLSPDQDDGRGSGQPI
ncbi:hypothetical protein [Bradyrhizobium sp.]|uniref:hypothetical protein n=1 Tax=Bradyrhizobium sp. TaxID=376 RepID=UPI002638A21D|nr:hypothetical protein [Bradyrhizobium sp.]